jgi:hypothetical protein
MILMNSKQFKMFTGNVAIKVKCTTWGENYNESIDLLLYVDDNEEQKKN